jgi:hypothetical protein
LDSSQFFAIGDEYGEIKHRTVQYPEVVRPDVLNEKKLEMIPGDQVIFSTLYPLSASSSFTLSR